MRISIIEICEANHFTAAMALAQTYAFEPSNHIEIFTVKPIAHLFKSERNIKVIVCEESQTVGSYLKEIAEAGFDRIHINTLSKFYTEFASVNWQGSVYFTIHNTELFFDNNLLSRLTLWWYAEKKLFRSKKIKKLHEPAIQFVKEFGRQASRQKFIDKLKRTNFKIIAYSHSQGVYLKKFVNADHIVVFPFCLFENIKDTSISNRKIRICIPGSVSNTRRDYTGLFKLMNDHCGFFAKNVTLDILGYIPPSERHLLSKIEELISQKVEVFYNIDFIDTTSFDVRLGKADIILGNIKVSLNPNQRYGETKETGVIFNAIRCGKPALLPATYNVDDNLKPACIFYQDDSDLFTKIALLFNNKTVLNELKIKALEQAKNYTPQNLYNKLAL
jgi:hypothetical protein